MKKKVKVSRKIKAKKKQKIVKKAPVLMVNSNYIETSIDKLLELINKKDTISISYASKVFDYPKAEIEEWAKALADHGLIEIKYTLFGILLKKRVKN
jgi:predicted transcriptional regulator